jgi:serine/threonine-protein kinase
VRCGAALPEVVAPPLEQPDEELAALRLATGTRYTIVRRLGSGGMAHVYLATQVVLGRTVVIKVLHKQLAQDQEMRERFRREAEAAARLVHPNICPITDHGALGDVEFLVMPYFVGGSLADLLTRQKTVAPARAATIAAQVATGLDYAHRRGVVHRDVKPDNVLFDEDGNIVLTDFGIATARFHARMTATGRAMGTPHYMSPEQAMGRLVDGRSDLYAVGLLLYEMLLGYPPFDGADSYSVGYKHVHEEPITVQQANPKIPEGIAQVTMRCLRKAPDERYERGFALADALLEWLSTQATPDEQRAARVVSRPLTPAR